MDEIVGIDRFCAEKDVGKLSLLREVIVCECPMRLAIEGEERTSCGVKLRESMIVPPFAVQSFLRERATKGEKKAVKGAKSDSILGRRSEGTEDAFSFSVLRVFLEREMVQRERASSRSESPEPRAQPGKQPVQGDAPAAEAVQADIKSVQHLFLQAFLSRRIMSNEAATELLTAYCQICKGSSSTRRVFFYTFSFRLYRPAVVHGSTGTKLQRGNQLQYRQRTRYSLVLPFQPTVAPVPETVDWLADCSSQLELIGLELKSCRDHQTGGGIVVLVTTLSSLLVATSLLTGAEGPS